MVKKPSNVPLIVAIVFVLVLLVGANMMAQNNNPEIQERLAKEKQEQEAAKQAKEGSKPKGEDDSPATGADGGQLVMLGDRALLGPKDAKSKVTVAYSWTPAVQANPKSVYQAVEQLKKMAPNTAIEVVNADANPAVPTGITINGKMVIPARTDGTFEVSGPAIQGLMSAIAAANGAKP